MCCMHEVAFVRPSLSRAGTCVPCKGEGVGGMFCLCGAVCLMLWTIPVVVHVPHHGMAAPGLPYPGAPLPRIHPLFQGAVATMDDFGIDMKKVAEVTTSLKRNGRLAFWWGTQSPVRHRRQHYMFRSAVVWLVCVAYRRGGWGDAVVSPSCASTWF